MSRVGKGAIVIPGSVNVSLSEDGVRLSISSGSRGTSVMRDVPDGLKCVVGSGTLSIVPSTDLNNVKKKRLVGIIKARWGLFRVLVANDVKGMSEGFSVLLDITGVGYKASVNDSTRVVSLNLGYSHDLDIPIPGGIVVVCTKNVLVELKGHDKRALGDFAAKLESFRIPDPYKLKGIVRRGRFVPKKEGKAG